MTVVDGEQSAFPTFEESGRTPGYNSAKVDTSATSDAVKDAHKRNKNTDSYEGAKGGHGQKGGDANDGQRYSFGSNGSPLYNYTQHRDETKVDFQIARVMREAVRNDDRARNKLTKTSNVNGLQTEAALVSHYDIKPDGRTSSMIWRPLKNIAYKNSQCL